MMGRQQPPPEQKGDIRAMLSDLNISWNFTDIVWDGYNPHPELELTEPEIVFVTGGNGSIEPFNPRERITSGLQEVVAIFGGHVTAGSSNDLKFAPLVRSGKVSGTIDKSEAFRFSPFGGQGLNPNRRHVRNGGERVLACRVTGKPSAEAESSIDVIFVADLDMIGSMFFSFRKRGLGNTKIEFDNVTFILNCVDELAGEESFIDLRKRRPMHRTLQTLEQQQEQFQRRVAGPEGQGRSRGRGRARQGATAPGRPSRRGAEEHGARRAQQGDPDRHDPPKSSSAASISPRP